MDNTDRQLQLSRDLGGRCKVDKKQQRKPDTPPVRAKTQLQAAYSVDKRSANKLFILSTKKQTRW